MNKEWVEKKRDEAKNEFNETLDKIIEILNTIKIQKANLSFDVDEDVDEEIDALIEKTNYFRNNSEMVESENIKYYFMFFNLLVDFDFKSKSEETKELSDNIKNAMKMAEDINFIMRSIDNMDTFLDSEPVEFEGDIVITDPCYFIKDPIYPDEERPFVSDYFTYDDEEDYPDFDGEKSEIREQEFQKYKYDESQYKSKIIDDWDACDCGNNMEVLGFSSNMCRNTIIGDWSCAVIDDKTNKPIGRFCADAGEVCVVLLDDIKKYNPKVMEDCEDSDLWTIIKDFKGSVRFIVSEEIGFYKTDSEYHKAGDKYVDYSVIVKGHGINTKTNEPIDFSTRQIGF